MEIRHTNGISQRNLKLDKGSRDAMADYWRHRWPSGTAKHGAREFGLTLDQGRSVVAGRASITTLDQIEKAGGWPVIIAVKALVIGHGIDQHITEMRKVHEEHGKQLAALFGPAGVERDPDPGRASSGDRVGRDSADHADRHVGERRVRTATQ